MDLMQLEMFVAAVEEGNFRKAASRVYRTQPAVSMALKKLEDESGVALFDRSDRNSYSLTDAGQSLFGYAKRMLCLREEALAEIGEVNKRENARLRIGTEDSTEHPFLSKLVSLIVEEHPASAIETFEMSAPDLLRGLRDSSLDLVLLRDEAADESMVTIPAATDELFAIVPCEHRWFGRRSVKTEELAGEPMVLCRLHQAIHETLFSTLRRSRTKPVVKAETSKVDLMKRLVSAGAGVGLAPWASVKEEALAGKLWAVKVSDAALPFALWAAHRKAALNSPLIVIARRVIERLHNISFDEDERPSASAKHLKLLAN